MAEFFGTKQSGLWRHTVLRSTLIGALLALSGCALIQPEPLPPAAPASPEPEPAPEPAPPVDESPAVVPEPVVEMPPAPRPVSARVAILLTDGSLPAYADVAEKLTRYLDDYALYDLADRNRSPRQVFADMAESETRFVVAIGLRAAKLAKTFASAPVTFSQVFNVRENSLLSATTRGVAVLPPLDLLLEAWREMDPKLQSIGAILGDGHDEIIAEARQAASKRGIGFRHAIANSDRETIYHFKRLVRDIDGYLLFPDNRILSSRAFSEIMTEAARHHVQVAVFNESLLKHGATFSASSVASNIADKITISLNEIESGKPDDGAAMMPLSEIRIRTNPAMVRTFGLVVDEAEIDESVADAQ